MLAMAHGRFVPADVSDPPFKLPPDVVLDIPVPPSVNRTRQRNKAAIGRVEKWCRAADASLMASGQFRAARAAGLPDRVEINIILNEKTCALDLDNGVKSAIDYLCRIELIRNDDKRYVRKLTVEWGEAPEGCRLVLRGAE